METWVLPREDEGDLDVHDDDDADSAPGEIVRFVVPHETGEVFVEFCFLRDGLLGKNGPANRLHLIEVGCSAVGSLPSFGTVPADVRRQVGSYDRLRAAVAACSTDDRTQTLIAGFVDQLDSRLVLGFGENDENFEKLRELDKLLDHAVEHAPA